MMSRVMMAQGWGDFVQWLEGHQASAEVFLAVAALALTAGLVWATWTYAREMREQRLDALRPLVLPRIDHATAGVPSNLTVTVENLGHGPAVNVSVEVEHSILIYSRRPFFLYLKVGESQQHFLGGPDIPFGTSSEDLVGVYDLKARYGDVHGRYYETELPVEVHRTDNGELEQSLGKLTVRRTGGSHDP